MNAEHTPKVPVVVRKYRLHVEHRHSVAWDAQFPDGEVVTFVVQPSVARLLPGAVPAYNEVEVRELLRLWGPKIARCAAVDVIWALGSEPQPC